MKKATWLLLCLVLCNSIIITLVDGNPIPEYPINIIPVNLIYVDLNLNESKEYNLFPDIIRDDSISFLFEKQTSINLDFGVYYTNSAKFVFSYENYTGLHYDITYHSDMQGDLVFESVRDHRTKEILVEQEITSLVYNPLFIFSNNNSNFLRIVIFGVYGYEGYDQDDIYFSDDSYNWWLDSPFGLTTLIILSSLGIVVFFVGLSKLLDFILDKIGEYENKKWELKKLEAQNIIDNND